MRPCLPLLCLALGCTPPALTHDAGGPPAQDSAVAGPAMDAGAPPTQDAGTQPPDAGMEATVAVQLHYHWRMPQVCPVAEALETCDAAVAMARSRFVNVAAAYPGCSVTESANAASIDCRPNCTSGMRNCGVQAGNRVFWACQPPAYTPADACGWSPP